MTPQRWKQVQDWFDRTAEMEPPERSAYLNQYCTDPELRGEVLELLLALEGSHRVDTAIQEAIVSSVTPIPKDGMVGRFRVVRELGRGGMGVVYLAQDGAGSAVAIKIARTALAGSPLLERFRREGEILASLDHGFIARLLEGGTTSDGLPYVVLEYVDGTPIHAYCDRIRMPIPARVHLFAQVCEAVQYAHTRRVIHRDLKPANILVTPEGIPKLLDFGIAKLLAPGATITRGFERLLTPECASPEQILGATITPASDVWALGLLLFELASGRKAFPRGRLWRDGDEPRGALEALHHREAADETPEEVAWLRATPVAELDVVLTRLDRVLAIALRRQPERRWPTAAGFAAEAIAALRV